MFLWWFFSGLAFEKVEAFANEGEKFVAANLEVMRGDNGRIDFFLEQFFADLLFERGIVMRQEAALALEGFDDALAFEFGVSLGDGVTVDP